MLIINYSITSLLTYHCSLFTIHLHLLPITHHSSLFSASFEISELLKQELPGIRQAVLVLSS